MTTKETYLVRVISVYIRPRVIEPNSACAKSEPEAARDVSTASHECHAECRLCVCAVNTTIVSTARSGDSETMNTNAHHLVDWAKCYATKRYDISLLTCEIKAILTSQRMR